MTQDILLIILVVMIGLIGYLHYIIHKQKEELKSLWTQIAVLALQTSKKIIELDTKIKKTNDNG
jgi:hypothetical protein